jgi:hypothetical protein
MLVYDMIGGQQYYYFKMCKIHQIRDGGGWETFFYWRIQTLRVKGWAEQSFFQIL